MEKGDTLWKILERNEALTPDRYTERLKEFRRANPKVADPSRLYAGPAAPRSVRREPKAKDDGRTVAYTVKRGDSLSKILSSRRVPRRQWKDAPRCDPGDQPVGHGREPDRRREDAPLPTDGYFAAAKPPAEPEKAMSAGSREGAGPRNRRNTLRRPAAGPPNRPGAGEDRPPEAGLAAVPPPEKPRPPRMSLPRRVDARHRRRPGQDALAAGKPEAELLAPKPVPPDASVVETGKAKPAEETITPPARSPYRGLLSDLFPAIGEKWVDRGTMYLPLPSGGDAMLQLSDFPVVRFSGGAEALIDFRGGIPPRVADAISAQWKSLRVVSLADAGGAGDRIDRILRVSGYHSVKEGISRPVVMGETVSVALPARWVIQRTEDSLLSGDLVLLKEVPEKPDPGLLAVLRYARRVGLRVLPYADDPNAMEGFLVGVQEEATAGGIPVALAVPKSGGLPAVDFGLSLLGIAAKTGERLRVGGKGTASGSWFRPSGSSRSAGRSTWSTRGRCPPRSARSSGNRGTPSSRRERMLPAGRSSSG